MAIADHNSVRGSRKLLDVKKEDDPAVVPAIELDCTCEGKDFHLLGYGIDVKDPVYEKIENDFFVSGNSEWGSKACIYKRKNRVSV